MLLSLYLGTSMWRLFSGSEEHTAVPLLSLHLSNASFLYCPTHCNATFAAMKGCGFVNSGEWGHCGQPQNVTRINALLKRDLVCLILKDLDVVFKLEGAVIVPASKMKEILSTVTSPSWENWRELSFAVKGCVVQWQKRCFVLPLLSLVWTSQYFHNFLRLHHCSAVLHRTKQNSNKIILYFLQRTVYTDDPRTRKPWEGKNEVFTL